ncbi:MAG: PAS domain S-box protein, partial [Desulfobacteraceae bacterium]|nr:PAS domain S-box protein [Desulfobacteraceae bacterium]
KRAEEELKQSEKNLSRMFQFADYMVCIADLEKGHFTKISPAFTKHLGWSENEMLSKPILDFIHPADVMKTADIIKEQMEKGVDVIQFENRYKTKKGDFRWFEWSANPVPEEGITYSAAYDITERKRAEVEKEKQKQLLDATGSIANVGGWSIDAKTNELTWTEEVYRIFEIEDEFNPTIESAIQFWMPESRAIIESAVEGLLNTGESYDLTLEIKTAKDNFRWVHTIGKVNLKDDKIVNFYGSIQDITELKQTEKKRKELEDKLQQSQKMESIGNLAGGIAHDFNNLLCPIIGFAEMLKEDLPPNSPEHESAQEIFNAGRRGGELVKQILAFSHQSDHKMQPVRFQKILKEVYKLSRSTIPSDIKIH